MNEKLVSLITDLEEAEALKWIREQLEAGADPLGLLEACRAGMVVVGQRFESEDYFISDLIMAGEIFKQASKLITPHLRGEAQSKARGPVVIGTVKGDIHDIGKDIVVNMLRAASYEVHDLGVDVPPERFVEAVAGTQAPVVAMSGLLTISFDPMKETVAALAAAGLRDRVKVMIGGGPVTDKVCEYAGADAFGGDAQAAVSLCRQWIGA